MKSLFCGSILLLLIILCSITYVLTSVVSKYYKKYDFGLTWSDAQSYCSQNNFTDLATIYKKSDLDNLDMRGYLAWVGLERDTSNWWFDKIWVDGITPNYDDWLKEHPDFSPECAALSYKYYDVTCGAYHFFFCESAQSQLQTKTWSDAQNYCTSVGDELENVKLSNLNLNHVLDFPIWIGLHKNGGSWRWSTGSSDYRDWNTNPVGGDGRDCVSISSVTENMATQNCETRFPFICMGDNVLLVKENKSWEEALEHCRGLPPPANTNLHFDLLSVEPGEEQVYVMTKVLEATTEEVWTGLRFLASEWLWVNGAGMLYSDLPLCPNLGQHCGALSKNSTDGIKTSDCLERKNFLCYSY